MIDHKKFTFMMHCGAEEVPVKQLESLRCPEPDYDTGWTPVPHFEFQQEVKDSLSRGHMRIVNEAHAITHNKNQGDLGDRYFGLFQLEGGNGTCEIVGLRNSHDKTFAASLVMGMGVFVCDNLSFSGEVKVARKHTRYIQRDMPQLIAKAVANLNDLRGWQQERVEAYQETTLDTRALVNDLIMESFRSRALPPSQIGHVLAAWEDQPNHEKYAEEFGPRNAWSLFNAFTETFKNRVNPHVLSTRTQLLHGVFDNHIGLAKPVALQEV